MGILGFVRCDEMVTQGKTVNGVGRSEPVVDIDDGNPRGTGVQHAEKCGDPLEVSAIANGGRHGDEGGADESPQNAGQGGLHSSHDHKGVVLAEGIQVGNRAMKAGDPDIIESRRLVSQKLKSDPYFLGHGVVGGSSGTDGDAEGGAREAGGGGVQKSEGLSGRVILAFGKASAKSSGFRGVDPSRQNRLAGGVEASNDGSDLRGGLACPVDDFGCTETFLSGEIQVGKGARQNRGARAATRHKF